jgi:hypothetical protein
MYSSGYNVWEQPTAYSYRIMQKTCSARTFIPGTDIEFVVPKAFGIPLGQPSLTVNEQGEGVCTGSKEAGT